MNGGRSVVIAGTFLPREDGKRDPGAASHVIEYWPESGKWRDVATLQTRAKSIFSDGSPGEGFVVVDGEARRRFARDMSGSGWREATVGSAKDGEAPSSGASQTGGGVTADVAPNGWQLSVEQALNQPPDIVARSPGGAAVRLTELNPQYSAPSWGTMREFSWQDASGRTWNGGLMVPAGFDPRRRHAVVIQTYGFSPSRFYRDGANIYDGYTSGFAGRAFLRENILVLALPLSPVGGLPKDVREQRVAFVQGVRGAIDALVAQGIVDRERIGLMGWSATGELVLNLVTFSDVPIRAASLLDGDANTLFSLTITNAATDSFIMKKERANGGGLFGPGRARWLSNDPSLHTHCLRAAMRIETYSATVHNNWDIYALLRRQYKPVEMIMFPEGAHALGRPSDRMISLQGNVDWYRFWLNGEKRSTPVLPGESASDLAQQYARWEPMLDFKRLNDTAPPCTENRLQ